VGLLAKIWVKGSDARWCPGARKLLFLVVPVLESHKVHVEYQVSELERHSAKSYRQTPSEIILPRAAREMSRITSLP